MQDENKKKHTSNDVINRYKAKTYTRVYADLPKELVEEFYEKLKEDGINRTDFIRNAIKEYLK